MEHLYNQEEIIKYNKRFGIVTENRIHIIGGSNPEISIDAIQKVKLVKNRVFYTNYTFLFLTITSVMLLYFYFEMHIAAKTLLFSFALATLIYTFIHKFYQYKIVIKLNNNERYTMKATQIHRKCIKEFYYAIYERTRINKKSALFELQAQ